MSQLNQLFFHFYKNPYKTLIIYKTDKYLGLFSVLAGTFPLPTEQLDEEAPAVVPDHDVLPAPSEVTVLEGTFMLCAWSDKPAITAPVTCTGTIPAVRRPIWVRCAHTIPPPSLLSALWIALSTRI